MPQAEVALQDLAARLMIICAASVTTTEFGDVGMLGVQRGGC
jgi:hypothetical protein